MFINRSRIAGYWVLLGSPETFLIWRLSGRVDVGLRPVSQGPALELTYGSGLAAHSALHMGASVLFCQPSALDVFFCFAKCVQPR